MYGQILQSQLKVSLTMYLNDLKAASSELETIYDNQKIQINQYFVKYPNISQSCVDSIKFTYNPDVYREKYIKCADNTRAASAIKSNQLAPVLSDFVTKCESSDVSFFKLK